jgi:hypothetical protein
MILAAAGFLFTFFYGTAGSIVPQWTYILIAAIPMLVFLTIFLLSLTGKMKGTFSNVITAILFFLFLLGGVFNIVLLEVSASTTATYNIKYYTRFLKRYGYPDSYVGCFLKEVPENVVEARFYECPQFLQGGSNFYLYLRYEEEPFQDEVHKLNDSAMKKIPGSSKDSEYYLTTGFQYIFELPSNVGSLVYYIQENRGGSSGGWNHGAVSGVAVNEATKTIVYYAEQW